MDGKVNLIGQFATDWLKYSDYEIKESSAGEVYITPAKEASFTMYNPFNVAEDLILDLINLGDNALKLEADNQEDQEKLNNDILIFARKYGLLGLISASVYNRNVIGDKKVLFIENNLLTKEKMMNESNYLSKFIPFTKEGDIVIKEYKNSVDVVKREDSPKYYGKRPLVLDLVFSRFYSEQLKWIIDFAKMISSHFNQLLIYQNEASNLTESVTIMAGKFQAHKIGFTINQLDKTNIAWQFDSLKTAIETVYAFAVTDESTLINRCKYCDSAFISNNTRTKYCSVSCRNCANVQKSRERKAKDS
jgi:hypothetical protein